MRNGRDKERNMRKEAEKRGETYRFSGSEKLKFD